MNSRPPSEGAGFERWSNSESAEECFGEPETPGSETVPGVVARFIAGSFDPLPRRGDLEPLSSALSRAFFPFHQKNRRL